MGKLRRRAYGTGALLVKGSDWYGRWRTPDGRRVCKKLGPVGDLSKKAAEAKLREQLLEVAATPAPSDQTTVAELGETLKATLKAHGRKRSHLESVHYHLANHIDPLLGSFRAATVNESDVRRLVDRLLREGKKAKTVRNVVGTLHSVLGLAVERRLLDRNPAADVRLPVVRRDKTLRFLTLAQVERVLLAAPPTDAPQAERDWWPVVRLLILTGALSGMRLGELRGLRWIDLDMGASRIRVRQTFVRGEFTTPKSEGSVRAIPLASRLVGEFDEHFKQTLWKADDNLVLAHPHTGRPLDRVRLLGYYKAALERANVSEHIIHDLRHTFGTAVAASGKVSLRTLQEWMGHADIKTTMIYAAYMPGEREQQMLDDVFGGGQVVANLTDTTQSEATQSPVNIAPPHRAT